jgi:putative sterol carrier protein
MADEKNMKRLEDSLTRLSGTLGNCAAFRPGEIVLRLSGDAGGEYCISCRGGEATIAKNVHRVANHKPLLEVWGDADIIRAIVDGEKDAVKQFLTGGLRIRGNIRYFSDIAVELGILKNPL